MQKLIRVTTSDISLYSLLKGQLRFLNKHFEVVGVSANTGRLAQVAEREGIRTEMVDMDRAINIKKDIRSLFSLIRLFQREKPYIVHANTPKGSLLSMIAAWICRVPHRIYTVTGLRFETTSGLLRFILVTMERITCLCATKVIPEGDGVKAVLQRNHITGKPLNKILNGNLNGINLSYFSHESNPISREEIRRRYGIDDSEFIFIFIGRIVGDKGMTELAEAMKALNGACRLILVGNFEDTLDPLRPDVKEYFTTSRDVIFTGYQDDVRPFLAAADALAFPSYREGFPNVVLQAGAMGLPSIVTDINGCNEIIIEGRNGVIIPSKDAKALTTAMRQFINNPQAVSDMAANARQMIASRYNQDDVWNALLAEYNALK